MDNYYVWLFKTPVGDLFLSARGNYTEEEAALVVREVMLLIKMPFTAMIPRKRIPDEPDSSATISQNEKSKIGYDFYAGRKFWEFCGRAAEFDAEMILFSKQLHEKLREG